MLTRLAFEINTSELLEADIKIRALGNALDRLARRGKSIDIPPIRKNATRKIKNMVLAFASNVAYYAQEYTAIGDPDKLNPSNLAFDQRYFNLYEEREDRYGIEMTPGFHKGAWRYSESKNPALDPTIRDLPDVMADVKRDVKLNYAIGDTFYIAAKGPAFSLMESGQIPQVGEAGIVKPTLESIMATYANTLLNAYKRG